eukprot:snap_masked-scaffold_1-processed-gene-13.5-mRNA-1 protein AED:1.00 eAED:1.00 QI:0/0/0/0/1/1/2/0/323
MDTGADMNVASTHLISPFQIKEEKPWVIKEVQTFDGKRHPVSKVSLSKIILVPDGYKLDIGVQRFFCIDVPDVKELIIGDRTLKYHGVSLQIKDSAKAEVGKKDSKPLVTFENSPLYFSAIFHNAEEIFADINGLIRRLATLDFIFVKGFRKHWNDLLQLFQDNSFKLTGSYIFYEKNNSIYTDNSFLFIQSHQHYFLFRSTIRKLPPIFHQEFTDISIQSVNYEDRLIYILSNLISSTNHNVEVGILPPTFNATESFFKDKRANIYLVHAKKLEDLDTQHFENLEKLPPDHQVPPVLISNLIDNVPDEFNETGIGEENIDLK